MSKKKSKKNSQQVRIEKCSVNGVYNPREIPLLKSCMAAADRDGGYANMNIAPDGTPMIIAAFPNVSKKEVNSFYSKELKIYALPVDGDRYNALLFRGALDFDAIIDPTIYPDNRMELLRNQPMGVMFLIDSLENKICGIKTLSLSETVRNRIANDAESMKIQGVTTYRIMRTYMNEILPFTPEDLGAKSIFLGKSRGITTRNLYTPD